MGEPDKPQLDLMKLRPRQLRRPPRILVHGPPGVGKTNFAMGAPGSIILLDLNDGADEFNPISYPFHPGPQGHVARSFEVVMNALDHLLTAPHDFTVLALDTVGDLQHLLWEYICRRDSQADITKYGWGDGYQVAVSEWRVVFHKLDRLRNERNMMIVMLAHTVAERQRDPDVQDDYHRNVPQVQKLTRALIEGWCEIVCYLAHEDGIKKSEESRARGVTTGQRILHLERGGGHNAKSRLGLPPYLEIPEHRPWTPLTNAINEARSPERMRAKIDIELDRIGDPPTVVNVSEAVAAAGDDIIKLTTYWRALMKREPAPEPKESMLNPLLTERENDNADK